MDVMRAAIAAALMLGLAGSAAAQQGPTTPQRASATVDVSRLPLDLERIQRELRQSTITQAHDGLGLRYQIEVYGRAPELRLFTPEDNLRTGPVPYGAPTHREMIEHNTPQEFRSPAMDFNALFRWLADKAKK
jgi:hypothetical protein